MDGLLHVLRTMYQWCVAAFSSGLWNIPIPIDQTLDSHEVQMQVKTDALYKQQWLPKQHPGKKSGHMLHLLCHQGPMGTICLQHDSDHVCIWPGYHLHHDTTKHRYSGVVQESTGEWNGTLFSSVMKVSSVCMQVMDVHA